MAVFNYRMQNILDIKNKLETQAKTVYAQANARLAEQENILKLMYDDIEKYMEVIRNKSLGNVDVDEIKWAGNAIEVKKQQIVLQKKNIEKAKREVEVARIKLNEVMIDRKTHEKLKERAFEEFKHDLAAGEAKEVDELVSYSYNNKEKQ